MHVYLFEVIRRETALLLTAALEKQEHELLQSVVVH